jgi:mono/diheme cytochrome c family protein
MPSVDVRPRDAKPDAPWKPMPREDMTAIAEFLASQEPGAPPSGDDAIRKRGEAIVSDRCTACHMYKGDGDLGSSELAPELAGYASVAWVRSQITNPTTAATYRAKAVDDPSSKGHMPRFETELPPADIDLLARFVVSKARRIPISKLAAKAAAPPAPKPAASAAASP